MISHTSPRPGALRVARRVVRGLLLAGLAMISAGNPLRPTRPAAQLTTRAEGLCGSPSYCPSQPLRLAGMRVRHDLDNTVGRVAVDPTAEAWQITAHYVSQYGDPNCYTCDEITASLAVDVDWVLDPTTGRWKWTFVSPPLPTVPFQCLGLVDMNPDCNPQQPYAYQLIVGLSPTMGVACAGGGATAYLSRVEFLTTSLSRGQDLSQDCQVTGPRLDPAYPTYHNNELGDWECASSCTGPIIGSPELSI